MTSFNLMTSTKTLFPNKVLVDMNFFTIFIELSLIYNVVLVSGIEQSDSDIYTIYIICISFKCFAIIGYYKILSINPCAIQ